MTPKMIPSTPAEFWKQLMGLVPRRTSRKALSIAFVVRTFFQSFSLEVRRRGVQQHQCQVQLEQVPHAVEEPLLQPRPNVVKHVQGAVRGNLKKCVNSEAV